MGQNLDTNITLITPKALSRTANRNSKVFALHKIQFPAQASLQLKTAARVLWRRVRALNEPVERIIKTPQGECVVSVHDDAALCMVTRALREVIDQRRIILRIPEPGKDTPQEAKTVEMRTAEIVEVTQPANSPDLHSTP